MTPCVLGAGVGAHQFLTREVMRTLVSKKNETSRETSREKEFFIDNLLVRLHFIIEMIWWTGLAPWEF